MGTIEQLTESTFAAGAQPALSGRFAIRSIPTVVVLRDGQPVASQAGLIGAEQLVAALDRIAATPSPTSARAA